MPTYKTNPLGANMNSELQSETGEDEVVKHCLQFLSNFLTTEFLHDIREEKDLVLSLYKLYGKDDTEEERTHKSGQGSPRNTMKLDNLD